MPRKPKTRETAPRPLIPEPDTNFSITECLTFLGSMIKPSEIFLPVTMFTRGGLVTVCEQFDAQRRVDVRRPLGEVTFYHGKLFSNDMRAEAFLGPNLELLSAEVNGGLRATPGAINLWLEYMTQDLAAQTGYPLPSTGEQYGAA